MLKFGVPCGKPNDASPLFAPNLWITLWKVWKAPAFTEKIRAFMSTADIGLANPGREKPFLFSSFGEIGKIRAAIFGKMYQATNFSF